MRFRRLAGALVIAALLFAAAYATNVAFGMRAAAMTVGTVSGLGVWQPVTILRDARGVPHIAARNEHDAFFAEGYVEASDRLFQMDLTRRFVEGRLAEIFGRPALANDEMERTLPVEQLAQIQWERLPPRLQDDLQAFADGVNAAMRTQPLPPEFRMLLYKPQPWRPQDSLVTSFGIVLDLADLWTDVANRQVRPGQSYDVAHPLTDPCYDAPVTQGLARISQSPHCTPPVAELAMPPAAGSNEWAAGSAHTATGRGLLANDPHLRIGIPGIWYLVDLRFPGYHAAGATFAGLPGVILGHDDRVAWGATNGTVASLSVFDAPPHLNPGDWATETFFVRFGLPVHERYYRGAREFGATLPGGRFVLVRWDAYDDATSQLWAFDGLDRAHSIEDGLRALRLYPGPTQNFVLADTTGRVAYQLAGNIPDDPAWGRFVHPARDLAQNYPNVPFDRLPRVAPSRNAIVWTANNKMYGPGYPYRLSPEFAPPYRAYRIAQLLEARSRYDVAYFAKMQMDTLSLPELELARMAGIRGWGGRFVAGSRIATKVYDMRRALVRGTQAMSRFMTQARRRRVAIAAAPAPDASPRPIQPWSVAGAVTPRHPLATLGISFLNGTTLPGDGDAFTLHVQTPTLSQSFRAVWDVGNWDAGGISIPQGESGEPGSGHYTDEATAWVAGALQPLPYSKAAVEAAATQRLTLLP
ncbi:MAG: penicillin acylase family protein [Candidatus Tyrphobacter sp.]